MEIENDFPFLFYLRQVQLLRNRGLGYVRTRSIINAAVFLFACFGATRSSLGDAFLMIRERGEVALWFLSLVSYHTVDCVINRHPAPTCAVLIPLLMILSARWQFLSE